MMTFFSSITLFSSIVLRFVQGKIIHFFIRETTASQDFELSLKENSFLFITIPPRVVNRVNSQARASGQLRK